MKKSELQFGKFYLAKVSGRLTVVRLLTEVPRVHGGGWNAINVRTNRDVFIKSAQRLRKEMVKGFDGKWRPIAKPCEDCAKGVCAIHARHEEGGTKNVV